jgi:hypothetical protein
MREVLPMVQRHFETVFVRGDAKFGEREVIAECEAHQARFALVLASNVRLDEMADALSRTAWKPFKTHDPKRVAAAAGDKKTRRKRRRWRKLRACQRGYKRLVTVRRWVADFDYTLPLRRRGKDKDFGLAGRSYRVVVQRQQVDTYQGHPRLFTEYRYRYVITNIPRSTMDAAEVFCFSHGRCDQENTIEQLKNGIAALRMPTGELRSNGVFLMAGQLAWCLRAWLSLLALPRETVHWEWKSFRHAFVYVAAKITHSSRQAVVRLSGSHRFVEHLLIASERLQSFAFR